MKINIVYNLEEHLPILKKLQSEFSQYEITLIDSETKKGKKTAFSLKSHWGARLEPFAIVLTDDEKAIKAFYSEADKNVIDSLNNFLKNEMLQNI